MNRQRIATPDHIDAIETRIYYGLILSAYDFLVWVDETTLIGFAENN